MHTNDDIRQMQFLSAFLQRRFFILNEALILIIFKVSQSVFIGLLKNYLYA